MKKIFISIFSLLCLLFILPISYSNAKEIVRTDKALWNDNTQYPYEKHHIGDCDTVVPQGMGANKVDTKYVKVNSEDNYLYFDYWFEFTYTEGLTYYLTIDGVKPNDQKLYVLNANEDNRDGDFGNYSCGYFELASDSAVRFKITFDGISKDAKYITFAISGGEETYNTTEGYYADKVYVNDSTNLLNYYTTYFYDEKCTSYSEQRNNGITENHFSTSSNLLVDVNVLRDSIKVSNNYTVTLLSDDYTSNYKVGGTHEIKFKVSNGSKEEIVKFIAHVIQLGSIKYKTDSVTTASYTYNMSDNIANMDFNITENLPSEMVDDFTFTLVSGTKKRFVFDDADITGDGNKDKINNFQDICKVSGTYTARWELYSTVNGLQIEDSFNISITIIDDTKPEIFVPKFVIYLNPNSTYTDDEFAEHIKDLLIINNIFASNPTGVKVTNNEYTGNEGEEGDYEVSYTALVDGHEYEGEVTLNVSISNPDTLPDIDTSNSNFNPSIIFISITAVITLGVVTYFGIRFVKRKHNN